MKYNKMFIAKFMTRRFGNQYTIDDYYEEWENRFNDTPENYMDDESLAVFKQLLDEEKENGM